MDDKQLKKIAEELSRLNRNFEKMILTMQLANKKLSEPVPLIGSEGEHKQSEK